jgi:hypothetical protein
MNNPFGTPPRSNANAPTTMSTLSPPQTRKNGRMHLLHTTFGRTYIVLEDSDKQITSMYFQIALEPDAVTGFCKNRAKGVLLPWQAIPKWNSSKQVWLWQELTILSGEIKEFFGTLDIFKNWTITESSGMPESCLQTPEGLKALLNDRVDELNVQDIEALFPNDEIWLRTVFGPHASLSKVLGDASGTKRRAFQDANTKAAEWKKAKTDAAAAATAAAAGAAAASATATAGRAGGSGSARGSIARGSGSSSAAEVL